MSSTASADKLKALAERLLERTRDGRVAWEQTDRELTFATVLKPGSVRIGRTTTAGYSLVVTNGQGTTLEQVAVDPDDPFQATSTSMAALVRILPQLHEMVRRQVLEVDSTLDSMLDQLG
jgi:hypothetical protein